MHVSGIRTAHWDDWTLDDLIGAKGDTRVSLVVPARNEAGTVGDVVGRVRDRLVDTVSLVDEIVVIDSDSTDGTYDVATSAGAVVHRSSEIRPDLGTHPGKGEAMWKSLFVTSGDVLVFMDADLTDWDTHFVPGLLGPLLTSPDVQLVKGFYERPGAQGPLDGGRVTELVARPLISLLYPRLQDLVQPLAGEWAVRRAHFASLSVPTGYAVELAALVDTVTAHGPDRDRPGRPRHPLPRPPVPARPRRHGGADPRPVPAESASASQMRRSAHLDRADSAILRQFLPGPVPLDRVVETVERPPAEARAELGRQTFADDATLMMAIVNRTPDSFYDQGATWVEDAAFERVAAVVEQGAEIVDIGGIKAAPGEEISASEERERVVDFVARVRASYPSLVISVDTWRAEVGAAACEAGADLLNDAWGGADPELVDVAAEHGAAIVCTHTGGVTPRTRPFRIEYDDVVAAAIADTVRYAERALAAGVARESIVIDPAHDFGKNTFHSLELTRRLGEMVDTGWPVLVSLSNKDFVGETLDLPVGERLIGTLAATAVCALAGARIYRVHEVVETRQVVDMVWSIAGSRPPKRAIRGLQ